jgi:Winged helix DNA-binding domain
MGAPSAAARRAAHFRNQALDRRTTDPLAFIRKLDLYSTAPTSHLALIARIKGYRVQALEELIAAREVVAMGAMRGSMYFVPADLIPIVISATEDRRARVEKEVLGRPGNGKIFDRLARRVEKALDGTELPAADIKKIVKPKEGDEAFVYDWTLRLMYGECRIIATGTTGTWKSNRYVYRLWDDWLPDIDPFSVPTEAALKELARIYFAAQGPATIEDFAWWSGAGKKAAAIVQSAGIPELGDGYFGTAARASTPSGARLLPYWDGAFLTLKDRSHLISDDMYGRVYDRSGNPAPVVLVKGAAAGVWTLLDTKKHLVVRAAPFKPFAASVWKQIEAEAELIATATGAEDVTVERFSDPPPIAGGSWNLFMAPLRDR